MAGHIGLTPVPDDGELSEFIQKMIDSDQETCDRHMGDLAETVEFTVRDSEPETFAYARMVNFLTDSMEAGELVHLCAAALWRLYGESRNQGNVVPIQPETDKG
ncbi:hypothetical protein PBI_DAMIEN_59 [Mycobacterium phage Damien]|uniref:Uncharacterized protein n=1 Tax=Mycobacterium phage Konstantine TaxID=563121 RepID=B5U533_9CAUD|nr:gp63 [Mycobacterium phage Konstantine]YP_009044048.1 hypothetical protein HL12_gp59 [Mycobacterium phage Damien]AVO26037.1 hypothetical protein SEA_THUMB_60 [Mycobacterium phage Thumb]AXH47184.1 hypothetical protein SEA_CBORCH11_61 [Mycobacterium phage Cborch11]QDH84922.1 hypothetical protein SEA_Phreeze_58 [Mycobacterium phage Phreeze]ACI12479.1 hypothetical protein KONSTANTINE_63 [Mycobacterium phage Konstantine]AHZ95420.1 hypothetical protein PBI_DAMIEN_59 [Mycobacterium phage Damien]